MSTLFTKIKIGHIFNVLAVFLLIGVVFIYWQYINTTNQIIKISLDSQIQYTLNLTNNIIKHIKKDVHDKNLYSTLKKNHEILKDLNEHLDLFVTKKYKYIYVIGKRDHGVQDFNFLLYSSKYFKKKNLFDKSFKPKHVEMLNEAYNKQKTIFYQHKKGSNLWMTFINPIVYNNKLQGLLIVDFTLQKHKIMKHEFYKLEYNFKIMLLFFILIFIAILIFAYIDNKRETEKDKIKIQLQQINKELEQRVRSEVEINRGKDQQLFQQAKLAQMGEMISMIAHQWRQPLNAISAASIKLDMKSELNMLDRAEVKKTTAFIQDMSQKMSQTINDFMNFTKPDQKQELVSLNSIFKEVLSLIQTQLKSHDIKLEITNNNVSVITQKQELMHILINLLVNARDALIDSSRHDKKIQIKVSKDNDTCYIKVQDNAGGVPKDIINRIFEPYFTTKEQGKGTGLGLYMSKKILNETLNGDIEVKNIDDGAVFCVSLNRFKKL